MVYLDTSFVAPLVIAEESSDAVEAFVLKLKPGELATSRWTQVELASLVSRKLRMGDLSASQAQAVRREFERVLCESFAILLPDGAASRQRSSTWKCPRAVSGRGTRCTWRLRRTTAPGRS